MSGARRIVTPLLGLVLALLGCSRADRPVRGLWTGRARIEGAPPTRVTIEGEARCLLLRHRQSDLRLKVAGTNPGGPVVVRAFEGDTDAPRLLATTSTSLPQGEFRRELRLSRSQLGDASWVSLAFDPPGLILETLEPVEEHGSLRVVVLGLDGLSWRILDPLVKAGRLPNFAALMRGGVSGTLLSIKRTLSPVVWTTIASGHEPQDHGIWDFVDEKGHLVNSTQVRTKRIWELLGEGSATTVGVMGWFVTWPVDRVAGFMLSDRSRPWNPTGRERPSSFYPAALQGPFEEVDRERRERYLAESRRFTSLPLDPEWRHDLGHDDPLRGRVADLDRRFLKAYLRDSTYADAGLAFYRALLPDVFFLYLRGADHAQHAYWFERAPQESIKPVDDLDRRYFGGLIDSYYVYLDEVIGRYRSEAPQGTAFMIVSDHGFRSLVRERDGQRRSVAYHEREGVYIMSGPSFRRNIRGEPVSVLDLAPLWLHAAGLPVAQDMPGQVPFDLLAGGKRGVLQRVATYGRRGSAAVSRSTDEDADLLEQFKALGYISE